MAKKNDAFYYDCFASAAELACKAAIKLDTIMHHFDPSKIEEAVAEMHEIEQEADELVHEINDALITAFITPIEREDIATLANSLDVVIDRIEGVLHRIYFTNIQQMRPDALEMSAKVVRATEQMHDLVLELPQFKRSKSLREHVITVNTIESECDDIYIGAMRELHTADLDPLTIISWRDVYTFLEYCADSCEFVADTVESIVMKNS
ncbi:MULTISPECIES: DUF47 domain-containing protein [unclassified Collinsella]|uniref:DUF47 domain-containing protein n=1 Tax=unclassified Collinsella TaxID=2637548 RepID=UPI0011CC4216|nr:MULTISPECIES: DUF47 family protein [unclassified Collinsella]TXF37609.1 DUF47 domain-containing protein [Collinsella sp. BA40]